MPLEVDPIAAPQPALTANGEQPAGALLLVARAGDRLFALPAAAVERIFRMAELTPLPEAPPEVAGLLNVQGVVLPVIDPRSRLGVPTPPPHPDQHLVLLAADARYLLWVDRVEQLLTVPAQALQTVVQDGASLGATHVARLASEIVPVFPADAWLRGPILAALDEATR